MSSVKVSPWDIELDVEPGESVFDASFRHGWLWPTTCYGQAQCTRCHMKVLAGAEDLPEPGPVEVTIVDRLRKTAYRREPNVVLRLACQVRPVHDLEVELRQAPVRRPD